MDQILPLITFETKKYFFQFWSESGIWVMVRFFELKFARVTDMSNKRQV